MTAPQPIQAMPAVMKLLSALNKLQLKLLGVQTRESLIFIILNDTIQTLFYDRAVLWSFEGEKPVLLGISGESSVSTSTELAFNWDTLVNDLQKRDQTHQLKEADFLQEKALWNRYKEVAPKPSILWIPIVIEDKVVAGLWLERWGERQWVLEELELIKPLIQAYGLTWKRFHSSSFGKSFFQQKRTILVGAFFLVALLFMRGPLRIVAPCEIIAEDPILITAPLEGSIAEVGVQPGQFVRKGTILFEYDKRVAQEKLRVAKKQVEIIQSELDRTTTLSFRTSQNPAITEIAVLNLKLQKEKINLDLAEYNASLLTVRAPQDGVVMVDNPDDWRGRPVRVGERVLTINDATKTKIRLFVPESDNVILDSTKSVKVFLNVDPETSRAAKILYISSYSIVGERQLPSFVAEAAWENPKEAEGIKMGLKGTSILYGQNVSLLYWMVRRPLAYARKAVGI